MHDEASEESEFSAAHKLVKAASAPSAAPIDDLVRRLTAEPAEGLLEQAAAWWPIAADPGGARVASLHAADVDTLRGWVEACKGAFATAEVRDRRDNALLGFLVAVAAARVHHDAEITGVSPDTLEGWLMDAAGACEGALAELLAEAAEGGPGKPSLRRPS